MTTTDIQPIQTPAVTYQFTTAELREKLAQPIPTAIDSAKTLEEVKRGLSIRRSLRAEVESRRKELKADSLEYGRRVDRVAKELKGVILETETPLQALHDAHKAEQERIKREAKEAEERAKAEELRKAREAEEARLRAKREAEEARLRAEREAEEKRLAVERAKLEAEKDRQRAERERQEAEAAAERERLAAERRELEEQRRQAEVEQARIRAERGAAERAERERREREERIAIALAFPQEDWEAADLPNIHLHRGDLDDPRIVARRTDALAARKRREEEDAAIREKERQAKIAARLEALRPDKERMVDYIDRLLAVARPELADVTMQAFLDGLVMELQNLRNEADGFGEP